MRLDRYLSNNLAISRKQASQWIKQGVVIVDDTIATSGAQAVTERQQIFANGDRVAAQTPLYLMLNKLAGYLSATEDSSQPTVLDLLPIELANTQGLQLVGRLDKDTTGLLLMTTDGQWNHRITSPKNECEKCYRVGLSEPLLSEAIGQLETGLVLRNENKPTKPCRIQAITDKEVLIRINEGKYHQVKRMFAAVGNHVVSLHRESIGSLQLPSNLAAGEYRHLTKHEVNIF